MTLRSAVVLAAIVLALGVLGFLLRATLSADAGVGAHQLRLNQLTAVDSEQTALRAAVLVSQAAPGADPKRLVEHAKQLSAARADLAKGDSTLLGMSPVIDGALRAYFEQSQVQIEKLNEYLKGLAQFVAAEQAFDQAGAAAVQQRVLAAPAFTALQKQIHSYYAAPSATAANDLTRSLARIDTDARELSATGPRKTLQSLGPAAVAALTGHDALAQQSVTLLAVPVAASLQTLQSAYAAHYQALLARSERSRLALVIYTVALLFAFGLVGLRMRQGYGELDRVNAELQKANAGLEKEVESRTGDLRKALEDLQVQQAQLIQSEKMASLGQMVAGVAHEINTPLGYARSNLGVVRESLPMLADTLRTYDETISVLRRPESKSTAERETALKALEQQRETWNPEEAVTEFGALLDDAEHGFDQISELVMALKDFSRVDRSRTELFNVNEGVETALKICQNQFKGRLEVEKDFAEVDSILCAPSQLNQVFVNILNNAGQAIEGAGTITLRTRQRDDLVEVAIRDSGCGMDEATLQHVFEPFFTTKPIGQGTGLGMSIVFRIVEDHGGRIEIDSKPGEGTEFRILLPRSRGSTEIAAVETASA